ncbi:MAG: hypothetical protein EOO10_13605 [Chitinophagaceae bacterium]|nr:MAG: hypothetical protein EOO10_13605 [Chitinophagaceae bacterium]
MIKEKRFWIGLSLLNLVVVALFGFLMRSKMLFPIPFLDYRNLLSAHSHFAFGGWVGLALITLLLYDVLPKEQAQKKIYQLILSGIEISSVGMALSFPFFGYNFVSIFFSTLYIVVTYVFGWVVFKDLKKAAMSPVVKWLSLGAVASLILSSVGPAGLSYIIITKSTNSLLYRDSIYTFLHLQYNGFFTLTIFAAFFSYWIKKGFSLPPSAKRFTFFLLASVVPTLFLALLWHNLIIFYVIAAAGCLCILFSVYYFLPVFHFSLQKTFFDSSVARTLWTVSFVSFIIKMVLTIGTIYPSLGNAVYGARPVIIGFLHLVFLAFVSFYLLSNIVREGYFTAFRKVVAYPFYLFGLGVLANEILLMIQGLEILLKTNNPVYNRLLWGAAILLLTGALALAFEFYRRQSANKKAAGVTAAS